MKANELRIGNYVNNMGVMIKFDEADWDCIVSKAFSQNPMERYEPIPLTDNWLLKFGFESSIVTYPNDGSVYSYTKNYLPNDIYTDCYLNFLSNSRDATLRLWNNKKLNEVSFSCPICMCQNVHQLQNLYFALTGQELTIKP
jgi:hypothetical protein